MSLSPAKARKILGTIRLINGTLALAAPERLIKMFGKDPAEEGRAIYALRLFGVRTVFLGLDLLLADDEESIAAAVRWVVPVHASDTLAAAMAGLSGQLPPRAALTGTVISSINTALATVARKSADA
jgi:hypothetical protein